MYDVKIQLEGPIIDTESINSLKIKPTKIKLSEGVKSSKGWSVSLRYNTKDFSFIKEILNIHSKYIQIFKQDLFIFEIELCSDKKLILSSFYKNKKNWLLYRTDDFKNKNVCVKQIVNYIKVFEKRNLLESFKFESL